MPARTTPRHLRGQPTPTRRPILVPTLLLMGATTALVGLAASSAPAAPARPRVVSATVTAPSDLTLAAPLGLDGEVADPSTADRYAADPYAADPYAADPTVLQAPAIQRRVAPARATRSRRIAAPAPPRVVRPGTGAFTSGFKQRWGRHHDGIDLAGPYGSPVRAAEAGTVVFAGRQSGYGNVVRVEHGDGTVTVYAHLASFVVRSGHVGAGELIAREGNSGHSTGPHLHFEVQIGGVPVDPVPWLAARGVQV